MHLYLALVCNLNIFVDLLVDMLDISVIAQKKFRTLRPTTKQNLEILKNGEELIFHLQILALTRNQRLNFQLDC